ncbi:L,D-transpeptidase [Candidatus Peregrinibacteria bacterium]|jgi:hypothetical protein|nr:L,D-transpeptidase [Candidatus Peregrinibacteria bacterium]MBT7484172.1 L,D-transpeptidase [Candidatus Peregrinibacteria bacterium]MBT7703615.1 L,D-transpeptidase [Candidatus Peregrinibacteria bacterium]
MNHPHQVHHGHKHGHHAHPHKKKKKKIKIFHPKKPWIVAAMIALTIGMGIGENYIESELEPIVALKISQNFQAASFSPSDTTKRGVMRAQYRVSFLSASSVNPLDKDEVEPIKEGIKRVCFWQDDIEEPVYSAEVTEVRLTEDINTGDEFRVEIYVENTGNTTWYGISSGCLDKTMVNLGTTYEQDRASSFFEQGTDTGWVGNNRIKMVEDVVQPGKTATFAFTSIAPEGDTIYREHFGLVAEKITWFDDFEVAVDVAVGEVTEADESVLGFMKTMSGDTASLEGERSFDINLSNQQMSLKVGEDTVYQMTISSGASSTPTPTGTWHVLNKQELRIGGAWPHYRMPYWQGFTSWGHGFHALPYLESDGGVFWSEALTHIGIPVSHGCIRMLPDDAITVYEFSEVGTEIYIHH